MIDKYSAALDEMNDCATILNNLGSACYDHAKLYGNFQENSLTSICRKQEKSEIVDLLEISAQKFVEGLALRSNDDTILFNYVSQENSQKIL